MLDNLFMTFKANRQLTYDILDHLSEEEIFRKWNRPGLDNFSKHFQEMAAVTNAYAEAMETGTMDFSSVPSVFEFQELLGKEKLKHLLMESDDKLADIVVNKKNRPSVFWFDMDISAELHFVNIISHEVFHQGMMTMFMYENRIQLPESLMENWSLPDME